MFMIPPDRLGNHQEILKYVPEMEELEEEQEETLRKNQNVESHKNICHVS